MKIFLVVSLVLLISCNGEHHDKGDKSTVNRKRLIEKFDSIDKSLQRTMDSSITEKSGKKGLGAISRDSI